MIPDAAPAEREALALPLDPRETVSIVIPCYKQAALLPEAIESALAQSYPHVEVIVVDDGSPDDVAGVVARYPTVRLVRQPNRGLSVARNAGLRAARGAYVVFLDADDRLFPAAVAAGMACFAEHPDAALVWGRFRFIAEDGTPRDERVRRPTDGDLYYALLPRNHVEMLATVLFRRDIVERLGGFSTTLRAGEDYDLLLRMTRQFPAYEHTALVAEYRRYERYGSSMSRDPARMLRNTMRVLAAQRPYVRGRARHEAALRSGVRFFQDYYGGELIDQLRARARQGEWVRAAHDAAVLVRYYPRGIVERIARRVQAALRVTWG
ncbi:MAG: glycosyltransferase [Gemmatimonadaceae bacterium]|nr:glycosyltransferase [Gemmatimonadaceae bacterium]